MGRKNRVGGRSALTIRSKTDLLPLVPATHSLAPPDEAEVEDARAGGERQLSYCDAEGDPEHSPHDLPAYWGKPLVFYDYELIGSL